MTSSKRLQIAAKESGWNMHLGEGTAADDHRRRRFSLLCGARQPVQLSGQPHRSRSAHLITGGGTAATRVKRISVKTAAENSIPIRHMSTFEAKETNQASAEGNADEPAG